MCRNSLFNVITLTTDACVRVILYYKGFETPLLLLLFITISGE